MMQALHQLPFTFTKTREIGAYILDELEKSLPENN